MRSVLVVMSCAVLACGGVRAANAGLPPENNSTIPAMIPIVGHDGAGLPDPIGEVEVSVRDLANNPVVGSLVVLDFSQCTELRLCADAHDPGVTVDCAQRTVRRLSDAQGKARFRVMGWSTGIPGGPGAPRNAAKVYADGVLLGSPNVSIYDLDGGGVGPADLAAWLGDFFANTGLERDDYDNSELVGPSDLSMWLKAYFSSGSIANCSPGGPCP